MLGRLTAVLAVGIGVAMLYFGQSEPAEPVAITETVLEPGDTPVIAVATPLQPDLVRVEPTAATEAPPESPATEIVRAAPEISETIEISLNTTDEPRPDPVSKILYVTGDRVNLRDGPSIYDPVVIRLNKGDTTNLIAEVEGGWMLVRATESGRQGFMSAEFLAFDLPSD